MMDDPGKKHEESSEIYDNHVIIKIFFVVIIVLIVIVAFLVGISCYCACCRSETVPRRERTTWSTDRRSKNRIIRTKKRKPIKESTDDVNTVKHSTSCDGYYV